MGAGANIFRPWSVRSWPDGWVVCHVAETGSTNTDVLAALDAGRIAGRTVLAAGHQTAGRGRLDRRWDAPPGSNLLVTLGFASDGAPEHPTQRVGLAALTACRQLTDHDVALKWPNDLLIRTPTAPDAKLAGVLAQRSARGSVAVGIGINIGWAPDEAGRLGDGIEPADVLAALLAAVDSLGGGPQFWEQYRAELATLGNLVRVELPDGSTIEGRAVNVDDDGRLIVDERGTRRTFDVGDVVHLRPAGG
ncbi:MAG: biotin--[acetyl-CoA-carboxylase] ligase [Actinomycetota bacterium]